MAGLCPPLTALAASKVHGSARDPTRGLTQWPRWAKGHVTGAGQDPGLPWHFWVPPGWQLPGCQQRWSLDEQHAPSRAMCSMMCRQLCAWGCPGMSQSWQESLFHPKHGGGIAHLPQGKLWRRCQFLWPVAAYMGERNELGSLHNWSQQSPWHCLGCLGCLSLQKCAHMHTGSLPVLLPPRSPCPAPAHLVSPSHMHQSRVLLSRSLLPVACKPWCGAVHPSSPALHPQAGSGVWGAVGDTGCSPRRVTPGGSQPETSPQRQLRS